MPSLLLDENISFIRNASLLLDEKISFIINALPAPG
jgi:hypothetical protein